MPFRRTLWNRKWGAAKTNFTVETPGTHHLSQVIKVNGSRETSCRQRVPSA